MNVLPSSPRLRRRLAWTAGLLAVAGATAIAIVFLPGGKPLPQSPVVSGGAPVQQEREVRLTPAMRRAINATIDRFVPAALGRRDPAAAWELAGPGLRGGTTRADWIAGDLPVIPYAARGTRFHGWRPLYAYRDRVGFDLLLHPRPGSRLGAIAFAVDVTRRGKRWLVDAWYPTAIFNGPEEKPWVTGSEDFTPNYNKVTPEATYEAPKFAQSRLSAAWFAVPLGILGAVLLALLAAGLLAVRRNRRAASAHAAARTVNR